MRRTDTGIEALHEADKDPGLPDKGSGAGGNGRMRGWKYDRDRSDGDAGELPVP